MGSDKARILIADDEENILEAVSLVLNDVYDINTAARGDDALRLYQDGSYDLVISDVRMPGLNGIDLFRKVRELNPLQKFIFVTVSTIFYENADLKPILTEESDGYLGKPYRVAELLELIRQTLSEGDSAQALG